MTTFICFSSESQTILCSMAQGFWGKRGDKWIQESSLTHDGGLKQISPVAPELPAPSSLESGDKSSDAKDTLNSINHGLVKKLISSPKLKQAEEALRELSVCNLSPKFELPEPYTAVEALPYLPCFFPLKVVQ